MVDWSCSHRQGCFCQLSNPPGQQQQQQRSKQVRGCQSNCRLQQEETGLNRCEQLPQPLGSHYVFTVRQRVRVCYHYRPALNATLQYLLHTHTKCFTKPSLLTDEVTPRRRDCGSFVYGADKNPWPVPVQRPSS